MTERVWSWCTDYNGNTLIHRDGTLIAGIEDAGAPAEREAAFIVDALNEKEAREAEASQAIRDTFVVAKGEDGLFWFRNGQYERVPDEAVAQMQRRKRIRDGYDGTRR